MALVFRIRSLPFDRFLIAQAQVEGMTLVSNEALFEGFAIQRPFVRRCREAPALLREDYYIEGGAGSALRVMEDQSNQNEAEAAAPTGRLAIYADPAQPSELVATIKWTRAASEIRYEVEGDADKIVARTIAALESDGAANAKPTELIAELKQAFTRQGLHTTDLPGGDCALEFVLDMNTGRTVARNVALHPLLPAQTDIGRDLFAAMKRAMRVGMDQLVEALDRSPSAAEAVGALRRAHEEGQLGLFPTLEVLARLETLDAASLVADDRWFLRQARLEIAQRLQRHDVVSEEAEALLDEFAATYSPDQTAQLEMAVAIGLVKRGLTEAALSIWRRLVAANTALDAEGRGWAWRNISMALPVSAPDARLAAQRSADAFLEAGDKYQAGTSLLRLTDCLMTQSPDTALEALNDMFVLVEQEGVSNQQLRAAVHHARANRLLALRAFERAFDDAQSAARLLEGLLGVEAQRISAMHLAAAALMALGREAEAKTYSDAADELTGRSGEPHFERVRKIMSLSETFDAALADELEGTAREMKAWEEVSAIATLRATSDPQLSPPRQLALLESVLHELRQAGAPEGTTDAPRRALASLLTGAGEHDRAATWWAQLADEQPWDSGIITNLLNAYVLLERWAPAEALLRRQIEFNGKRPGWLFYLGRVLCESGRPSEALTTLQQALRLADEGSDLHRNICEWREKALNADGTILPSIRSEPKALERLDLEAALAAFAAHISKSQRMSFWRSGAGKRRWAPQPERLAKDQLHTFLHARFADRIEVFTELAAGAGRLDLLLKLAGGLSVIVELKMCGGGYPSSYAAAGQDQILHYMENRDVKLGYLVIFDARTKTFATPVMAQRAPDQFTVFQKFIDVRASWVPSKAS